MAKGTAASAAPVKNPAPAALADERERVAPSNSQRGQELLRQARADLKAGRSDAARIKAEEVAKMHLTYDPFDDRPELVLDAIAIREAKHGRNTDRAPPILAADTKFSSDVFPDTSGGVSHAVEQTPAPAPQPLAKAKKERALALVRRSRGTETRPLRRSAAQSPRGDCDGHHIFAAR